MEIGKRLKSLRLANGMTQEQLAKKVNLSKANISKYESDDIEPNITTLNAFSGIFNVSVAYLLCENDNPTPPEHKKSRPADTERDRLINDFIKRLEAEEDISVIKEISDYSDYIIERRNRNNK